MEQCEMGTRTEKHIGQVEEGLDNLINNLDSLQEAFEKMALKLIPILTERNKNAEAGLCCETKFDGLVLVAKSISEQNHKVMKIAEAIRDLTMRIEL